MTESRKQSRRRILQIRAGAVLAAAVMLFSMISVQAADPVSSSEAETEEMDEDDFILELKGIESASIRVIQIVGGFLSFLSLLINAVYFFRSAEEIRSKAVHRLIYSAAALLILIQLPSIMSLLVRLFTLQSLLPWSPPIS